MIYRVLWIKVLINFRDYSYYQNKTIQKSFKYDFEKPYFTVSDEMIRFNNHMFPYCTNKTEKVGVI
jgi:phosphoenolpyruvate carboxylase